MYIVTHRKIFYVFSAILMVASIVSISVYGLKPSIEFTGGSLIEVVYDQVPDKTIVESSLSVLGLRGSVRNIGESGYIVRTIHLNDTDTIKLSTILKDLGQGGNILRFDNVGPSIGTEALKKSIISIILVLVAIVLFVAYAFRHVSEPVSSWKYGLVAIVALVHDVIIPTGVFAVLGYYIGYEIDTLFVTALLVVLGFSVHDTIVVFDRVRENLKNKTYATFEMTVGKSINQTFTRSITTSLTTLIALVALYIFGGVATEHFALALIIGIAAGTYSSLFIGSPLLVTLERISSKKA